MCLPPSALHDHFPTVPPAGSQPQTADSHLRKLAGVERSGKSSHSLVTVRTKEVPPELVSTTNPKKLSKDLSG